MAWNEPGNKDPWGRNKSNSSLDGVINNIPTPPPPQTVPNTPEPTGIILDVKKNIP